MQIPLLDSLYRRYAEAAHEGGAAARRFDTSAGLAFPPQGRARGGGRHHHVEAPAKPWRVRLFVWCAILAAVKLWLVIRDEVVARPRDAWFIEAARNRYWGGSFLEDGFLGAPGYPLWIALVDVSGVSLRLAVEFLLFAAAFLLAWCLRRIGHSTWIAVLAFAAVILHPVSMDIHNYAHPDTFYAPVLLLAVAFMILHYTMRDTRRALLYAGSAGFLLAVLTVTRPDATPALAWLLLLGVVVFISNLRRHWPREVSALQAVVAIVLPLIVWQATTHFVRMLNNQKYGVFALSEQAAPGFRALQSELFSIRSDSVLRFVPVPREARMRAYAASPGFAQLRPYLEGPSAAPWRHTTGIPGDTGDLSVDGVMLAVRDAARRAGRAETARAAEAYYQRTARELRDACADGRLACGRGGVSEGGAVFVDLYARFFQPWAPMRERDDPALRELSRQFNQVANRRRGYSRWPTAQVSGWAFVAGDPLVALRITDAAGRVLAAADTFHERPDVVEAFPQERVPRRTGFVIQFPLVQATGVNAEFVTASGAKFTLPAQRLVQRRPTTLGDTTAAALRLNVDEAQNSGGRRRPFPIASRWTENHIFSRYGTVMLVLSALALVGVVAAVTARRGGPRTAPAAGVLVLCAGIVITGLGWATAAELGGRTVIGYDRLFPHMCLYGVLVVLLISQGIRAQLAGPRVHEQRRRHSDPVLVSGLMHTPHDPPRARRSSR